MKKDFIYCLAAAIVFCNTAIAQNIGDMPREWTLEQCLEMSSKNNPYVKNARIDIASAKARKNEAMWEYFPTVGLNGIGYYAQKPLVTITVNDVLGNSDAAWNIRNAVVDAATEAGVDYEYNSFQGGYSAGVVATQPLFAGGRIVSGNRLASVGVTAARLQSLIKERDTDDEIERKYWTVVALQEKMKTLQAGKRLLDTLYRDVLSARESGLVTETEVSEVAVKRKEISAGEVTLRGALKLSKMDIFNAMGVQCGYRMLDSVMFIGRISELVPPEECLSIRPEGKSYEAQLLDANIEAKQLEKKMAEGEYLPEVGIGVSYGYGNMQGRFNGEKFNGVAFASVKIPLTGLGKMASRSKRYQNEVTKAMNEKEYLDSQLELRREKLWLDFETAYNQAKVAEYALESASETLYRVEGNYRAGRSTLSELLEAELNVRKADEEFIDRCIDYRTAMTAVKLY